MKTMKSFLLISLLLLTLKGECQNVENYYPFDIEINQLGGFIREEATIDSKELLKLNSGDSISVLELAEYPYFKVRYKNTTGYLSSGSFKRNESFDNIYKDFVLIGKREEIESRQKRILTKNLIGQKAPFFKLKNLNDKEYKLSDYKGKIILLELWGAGCGQCILAARELEKYSKYFSENNVELIIIESSKETALNSVMSITEKYNVNRNTLYGGIEIAELYGTKGFPTFFLLDKNGTIIFSHAGRDLLESPTKEDLFKKIEQL